MPLVNYILFFWYIRIEEYWDPVLKGLDQIVVARRIPAVHILLSLDAIDSNTIGYQTTNVPTKFWPMPSKSSNDKNDDDYVRRNKRSHNNRGGRGAAGGSGNRGGRNAKFQRNQS